MNIISRAAQAAIMAASLFAAGTVFGQMPAASSANVRIGNATGDDAQRSGSAVAIVAEIEVERNTGRIWGRKFTVAHDCGLIINPERLRCAIEGNIVQGLSRVLFEEVRFDCDTVTSADWMNDPILEIGDAYELIEVVLINRPEVAPAGAGEPSKRPLPAAVANAFFDATGVRLRGAPLSPERVKAALARS